MNIDSKVGDSLALIIYYSLNCDVIMFTFQLF